MSAIADEPTNNCQNEEINRQWEKALNEYPQDRLVTKLAALRTGLCGMIDDGLIDVDTAKTTWEQALTDALLERAREHEAKRGLLRLFATF